MAFFGSSTRAHGEVEDRADGQDLPEAVRHEVPSRFQAVGEALTSESNVTAACAVVGRDVARDGATLGEALDGLRATYRLIRGCTPDFDAAQAVSVAWAEATLGYLQQVSCEDPLTGLASIAHVRTRLAELYRHAEQAGTCLEQTHALVVVRMAFDRHADPTEHPFTRALHLVRVAEVIRTVFSGETIGRLGLDSAVVVVRREPRLGTSVGLLREFLADPSLGAGAARLWIEGLPASATLAPSLLDELAHTC
ncbi:MAG: hypothetical protein AVDCRST_MAG72-945 [uncultured Nocardioidaceae bacterium]|uniref:Uncharacterized protein n=1 Tax=uncultured Nocardioidaceae bacterium TaxID=253824 RepID=A0A6J4LWH6_9ACTN|nr:MAG: hypothetical protein AVDCRST_MAG72-945 [uncultured Nocardioidaceae bacterium]